MRVHVTEVSSKNYLAMDDNCVLLPGNNVYICGKIHLFDNLT